MAGCTLSFISKSQVVLKANVRALLNELTLLLGRKSQVDFFFFVRGVLKYILSPCDFCFPTWTCWKFCPHSVSVFALAARGKSRNRCHGFGVMQFERTLQSLLNDPAILCTHFLVLCLNQNLESGEHQLCSEISLFLENIEQCQESYKCSLNIFGVAHTVMVNPSPHPGQFMEQALLEWMQTLKCCESSSS